MMGAGDTTRKVVVEVLASADDFIKNTGLMGDAIKDVVVNLVDLEDKIYGTFERIGRKALMVGAGIQASLTANTFVAARWERQFTMVEKTIDGSTKAVADLEQGLRKISTDIPVSAGELAGIASIAGQLGIATESVEEFTKVAAELGVATDLTSTQAIVSLTRIIKVMGESEGTVRNLGNSLVYLGNTSNSTEGEILNFAENIAGTAGVVGMASAEVLGIASAFSSAGIEAEAGGTAVQKVLLAINEAATIGGQKLDQFTQVLNLSEGQFKNLAETDPAAIFTKFVDALSAAGPEAAGILRQMGLTDQRLTRAFLNVANSSESIGDAINKARSEYSGGDALSAEAAQQFDTLTESLQQFKNAMAEVGRSMGESFVKPFTEVVQAITKLVNGFNALPTWIKKTISVGAGFVSMMLTIAGTAGVFSRLLNLLDGIRATLGIKVVSGSLGALLRGMGAGFFGDTGLTGVLGQLFDRQNATKLSQMDGWLKRIASSFAAIGEGAGGAARGIASFARMAFFGRTKELAQASSDFGDRLSNITSTAAAPFRRVAGAAASGFERVKQRTVMFGGDEAGLLPKVDTDKIAKSTARMASDISKSLEGAISKVPKVGDTISRTLGDAARAVEEGTPELTESVAESAGEMRLAAGSVGKSAKEAARGATDVMDGYIDNTTKKVKQGAEEVNKALEDNDRQMTTTANKVMTLEKALGVALLAYAAFQAAVAATNSLLDRGRNKFETYVESAQGLAESLGLDYDPSQGGFDPGVRAQSREDYLRNLEMRNSGVVSRLREAEGEGRLEDELLVIQTQFMFGGATDEQAARAMRDLLEATFGPDNPIDVNFDVNLNEEETRQRLIDATLEGIDETPEASSGRRMWGAFLSVFSDTDMVETELGGQRSEAVLNAAQLTLQSSREGELELTGELIREMAERYGGRSPEMVKFFELISGLDDTLSAEYGTIGPEELSLGGNLTGQDAFGYALALNRQEGADLDAEAGITKEFIAFVADLAGVNGQALSDAILGIERDTEEVVGTLEDTRTEFQRRLEEFAPGYGALQEPEQRRIRDQFVEQQVAASGLASTIGLINDHMKDFVTDAERASEEYNQLLNTVERLRKELTQATLSSFGTYLSVALETPIQRAEFLRQKLEELKAAGADPALIQGVEGQLDQQGASALQQLRSAFVYDPETDRHLDRREKIRRDYEKQREDAREQHLERLKDMEESYNESLEASIEGAFNSFRMQERAFSGRQESLMDLLWNAEDQNKKFREFNSGMERFRSMLASFGADEELQDLIIGNLGLDDPANFAQLDRILNEVDGGFSGVLDDIVQAAKERQALVADTASEVNKEITEEYHEARDEVIEAYDEQTKAAAESFREQMGAAEAAINGTSATVLSNADLIERALQSKDPAIRALAELAQEYFDSVATEMEDFYNQSLAAAQGIDRVADALERAARGWEQYRESERNAGSTRDDFDSVHAPNVTGENMPFGSSGTSGSVANTQTQSEFQNTWGMSLDEAIRAYERGDLPLHLARELDTWLQTHYGTSLQAIVQGKGNVPSTALHAGGIVSGPTNALLGEGGFPEAVIPLNRQGASFMQQMAQMMAARTPQSEMQGYRGGGVSKTETHTYGPITVMADDPNRMRKELESKRRLQRLTQPPRSGVR